MHGTIPPLPNMSWWHDAQLKHGYNFAFNLVYKVVLCLPSGQTAVGMEHCESNHMWYPSNQQRDRKEGDTRILYNTIYLLSYERYESTGRGLFIIFPPWLELLGETQWPSPVITTLHVGNSRTQSSGSIYYANEFFRILWGCLILWQVN